MAVPGDPTTPDEREAVTAATIDAANDDDPDRVVVDGADRPLQQTLGRVASVWVDRLDPTAGPAQRLAARAHHLRRWETPRSDYPEGRAGYLRWRRDARARHAADVGVLMEGEGWDPATIETVQGLVVKQGLGSDPRAQTHEDAVCLAFLTVQLDDVAERLGRDRTVEVLRRTVAKMSPEALAQVPELGLGDHGRSLLDEALAQSEGA